jgi:ribosomal protein S19
MSRSRWKGPNTNSITASNQEFHPKKQQFKIASRNSEIASKDVGQTFQVHNGRGYAEVIVTKEILGHKFGEFAFTRAKFVFKAKKKKKKSKK